MVSIGSVAEYKLGPRGSLRDRPAQIAILAVIIFAVALTGFFWATGRLGCGIGFGPFGPRSVEACEPIDMPIPPSEPPPQLEPVPAPESAFEIRGARGILDGTTLDGGWVITGEWSLHCGGNACLASPYNNYYQDIIFEMTHDMARPDGSGAHSHTYTNFNATSLEGSDFLLRISGPVTGSGPVGDTQITITLNFVTGEFSFELRGNEHLQGEISGLIDDFLG